MNGAEEHSQERVLGTSGNDRERNYREKRMLVARERFEIRPLRSEDALQLGPLHVQIWRDTYTGLMSQEVLDGLDPDAVAASWEGYLGRVTQGYLGGFDRSNGALMGWIGVGDARDDDAPQPCELQVLNCARGAQGTGLADLLLARGLGDRDAYLWVLKGNERAIAFYRKHEFELDGCAKEELGATDLRMVRSR